MKEILFTIEDLKNQKITISVELQKLIPPQSHEERELLKYSIRKDGVRDPIIVFTNADKTYTVVDGHNRLEVVVELINAGVEIPSVKALVKDFSSTKEIKEWMLSNQLSRRNVNKLTQMYLIGKRYNLEKQTKGGNFNGSNDSNTAEKLAKVFHVGSATIKRAAKVTDMLNYIGDKDEKAKNAILGENLSTSQVKLIHEHATEEELSWFYDDKGRFSEISEQILKHLAEKAKPTPPPKNIEDKQEETPHEVVREAKAPKDQNDTLGNIKGMLGEIPDAYSKVISDFIHNKEAQINNLRSYILKHKDNYNIIKQRLEEYEKRGNGISFVNASHLDEAGFKVFTLSYKNNTIFKFKPKVGFVEHQYYESPSQMEKAASKLDRDLKTIILK